MLINHNLKETASPVLLWLLIKNGFTVILPYPIQSNWWKDPVHIPNCDTF